jgi:hypothetical protein
MRIIGLREMHFTVRLPVRTQAYARLETGEL